MRTAKDKYSRFLRVSLDNRSIKIKAHQNYKVIIKIIKINYKISLASFRFGRNLIDICAKVIDNND